MGKWVSYIQPNYTQPKPTNLPPLGPRHLPNHNMLCHLKELVVHYSFASELIKQKVGEDSFDVGLLGRCKACRDRLRTLLSMS